MKRLIGFSCLLLGFAACSSNVQIRTNVDPDNQVKYGRILVCLKSHEQTVNLFSKTGQYLDSIFKAAGLASQVYLEKSATEDSSGLKAAIDSFHPDGGLFLKFESGSTHNGRVDNVVIFGNFYDMAGVKSIWKASISLTPAYIMGYNDNGTTGSDLAFAIIQKLQEDGLIKKILRD